jgi:hypothetical protein
MLYIRIQVLSSLFFVYLVLSMPQFQSKANITTTKPMRILTAHTDTHTPYLTLSNRRQRLQDESRDQIRRAAQLIPKIDRTDRHLTGPNSLPPSLQKEKQKEHKICKKFKPRNHPGFEP